MIAHHSEEPRPLSASDGPAAPVKDRIRQLRRVRAAELKPHPCNWRIHPPEQRAALEALLAEIGYAGALVARELPDGSLQLIDGHLRAEVSPQAEVPVLVVDLDDREAEKLLALHDPIAAMAQAEQLVLAELSARIDTENAALRGLLDGLLAGHGPAAEPRCDSPESETGAFTPSDPGASSGGESAWCNSATGAPHDGGSTGRRPPSAEIPELYQLIVQCRDLCQQEALFDRLTAEGYSCRVVNTV